MRSNNHPTIERTTLQTGEEWSANDGGLVLILPLRGQGMFTTRADRYPLLPGDALVAHHEAAGQLRSIGSEFFIFGAIHLCFGHLLPLFSAQEIARLRNVYESFKTPRYHPSGNSVAANCHRHLTGLSSSKTPAAPDDLDTRAVLLRIAVAALAEEFKRMPEHTTSGPKMRIEDQINAALEALTTEEIMTCSVPALASRFGCSERHLNRLFHQHFGVSVAALRMEMRLLKAITLLRQSDTKIITVANECGFNQLGLFNRCFKRRFGVSPNQWRKKPTPGQAPEQLKTLGASPQCRMVVIGLCPWARNDTGTERGQPRAKRGNGEPVVPVSR